MADVLVGSTVVVALVKGMVVDARSAVGEDVKVLKNVLVEELEELEETASSRSI